MSTSGRQKKAAARLYATQALFQMESSGTDLEQIVREFLNHRFGVEVDGVAWVEGHIELFETILTTAVGQQARIDQATDRALDKNWPIDRIDPTLRALFRAAGGEFIGCETPTKVVISEFVAITRDFFPNGKEANFVNAVLDALARDLAALSD